MARADLMPEGIIERFLAVAETQADAVAIEYALDGRRWTYRELVASIERMKGAAERLGAGPGSMIAVVLPAGVEFIAAMFALASMGAVGLSLSPRLTPYEMDLILADARPAGVISDGAVLARYRETLLNQPSIRWYFSVDAEPRTLGDMNVHSPADFSDARSALVPPEGNPVVTCQYTYRGLGYPLGVPHRYRDFPPSIAGLSERTGIGPGSPVISVLPLYATFGILIFMTAFYSGATLVIVHNIAEHDLTGFLERYQAQWVGVVPILFQKMLREVDERGGRARCRFRDDLFIMSGAARFDADEAVKVADALGLEVSNTFGLTEGLGIASAGLNSTGERGTSGAPLHPSITIKIMDAGGDEVPRGTVGEIAVGGPTVSEGFWEKPRENRRFFRGGFFHTGDLGSLDAAGNLTCVGRAVAVTKVAAQMVDLREVESVLAAHPAVVSARAVARKAPLGRDFVTAGVIVPRRSTVTVQELQAHCGTMLSRHKIPAVITIYRHDYFG